MAAEFTFSVASERYGQIIYMRGKQPLLPFVKVQNFLDPPISSADLPRNLAIGDNAVRFILPEAYQTKHIAQVKAQFAKIMSDLIDTRPELTAFFGKSNLVEPGLSHTATAKALFLDVLCHDPEVADWAAACDWGAVNPALPLTFVVRGVSKALYHIAFKIDEINSVYEAEQSFTILEQLLHPMEVLITGAFLVHETVPSTQRKRTLNFAYYTGIIFEYRLEPINFSIGSPAGFLPSSACEVPHLIPQPPSDTGEHIVCRPHPSPEVVIKTLPGWVQLHASTSNLHYWHQLEYPGRPDFCMICRHDANDEPHPARTCKRNFCSNCNAAGHSTRRCRQQKINKDTTPLAIAETLTIHHPGTSKAFQSITTPAMQPTEHTRANKRHRNETSQLSEDGSSDL